MKEAEDQRGWQGVGWSGHAGSYLQDHKQMCVLKSSLGDFPGGPVVKNPPYSAGDMSSIPGQGTKIPLAMGQLSPRATTTELLSSLTSAREPPCLKLQSPHALEPARHSWRKENPPPQLEAHVQHRNIPHASTEIPRAATKTRRSQK